VKVLIYGNFGTPYLIVDIPNQFEIHQSFNSVLKFQALDYFGKSPSPYRS